MRDMKTKFGAEVESFRYAFVLPNHGQEWDDHSLTPEAARKALASIPAVRPFTPNAPTTGTAPGPATETAPRRRATDKQPTFIEIRPRVR